MSQDTERIRNTRSEPEAGEEGNNTPTTPNASDISEGLKKGSVGFLGSFYNSMAGLAPAYSVAAGAALILGTAYAASPLAMLLTLVGVLAIAYSVYILAKKFSHAASFYAYTSKTLGPRAGFLNGIIYTALYSMIGIGSEAIAFGYLGAEGLYAVTGYMMSPFLLMLIPIALAPIPAILGIRHSIKVAASLTTIEVGMLLAFVVGTIAVNWHSLSVIPFTVGGSFATGMASSLVAISGGLVFAITYFMGFEVSTQLSEEAKDPRSTVPKSTMASTMTMGLIYVLVTYAIVANLGYSHASISGFVTEAASTGPNPLYLMIGRYLGYPGMVFFALSVMISIFGSYLATLNSTARMLYGMSRDGLLSKRLASLDRERRTPVFAIYILTIISAITAIISLLASYALGYSGEIGITFGAMEVTYAVDSLYYVLSLLLIAISSLKVTGWAGKAVSIAAAALLSITFYYSIQYTFLLYAVIGSVAIIAIVSIIQFRKKATIRG